MSEAWVEKYRPETLSEVQGNNTDLREIKSWAENWTEGDDPLLLVGPPGVGKTATVQALANDMDWTLNEVNASSARTTEDIRRIARQMASQSLDGWQLVFLDEVDSFYHSVSLNPVAKALSAPKNPTILVGNKDWQIPGSIKRKCEVYEFDLGKRSIKAKLKEIADAEGISLSNRELGKLATRGNLRAAINDLQTYAKTGELGWDDRQTEVGNFEVVDNILEGKRYTGDITPDTLVHWLDENLTADLRGVEAAMAYDALARADKWLGRSQRTGEYTWWRYAGDLAERPADLRLTEPYDGWIDKSYPVYFRHDRVQADPSDEEKDTPEAKLYRRFKGFETGEFRFGGNFLYFRRVILPILNDMPKAVRYRIALDAGLDADDSALKALEISGTGFENWLSEDTEEVQASIDSW